MFVIIKNITYFKLFHAINAGWSNTFVNFYRILQISLIITQISDINKKFK